MAAPTIPQMSNLSVLEDAPVGTLIGTMSSTDPDGTAVRFAVGSRVMLYDPFTQRYVEVPSDGFPTSSLLNVDGDRITTAKIFDFENKMAIYGFVVEASDEQGEVSRATFQINVLDRPEPIDGDDGANILTGGSGDQILDGKGGNDRLVAFAGNDRLVGGSGHDILKSGSGDDDLLGVTGNDRLFAEAGNDRLSGGLGYDVMSGGAGDDRFIFETSATSRLSKPDVIVDFAHGDRIDLSLFDADTGMAGDQALTYLGAGRFTGAAGELRSQKMASDTYVYADLDGDRHTDFAIRLDDAFGFVRRDFVL